MERSFHLPASPARSAGSKSCRSPITLMSGSDQGHAPQAIVSDHLYKIPSQFWTCVALVVAAAPHAGCGAVPEVGSEGFGVLVIAWMEMCWTRMDACADGFISRGLELQGIYILLDLTSEGATLWSPRNLQTRIQESGKSLNPHSCAWPSRIFIEDRHSVQLVRIKGTSAASPSRSIRDSTGSRGGNLRVAPSPTPSLPRQPPPSLFLLLPSDPNLHELLLLLLKHFLPLPLSKPPMPAGFTPPQCT